MRVALAVMGFLGLTSKICTVTDGNPCDYNPGDSCVGVAPWYWQCCDNGEYYVCAETSNGFVITNDGETAGDCDPGVHYCVGLVPQAVSVSLSRRSWKRSFRLVEN